MRIEVDGAYCEVAVTPVRNDACPLIIHAEEATEMAIEFGTMSVAHLYAGQLDQLITSTHDVVESVLAGRVREVVGYINGNHAAPRRRSVKVPQH